MRLVEVVEESDRIFALLPGISVAWFFSDGFTSGVVSVTADLVVFGPRWNQAKSGQSASDTARVMAFDNNGCRIARVGLGRVISSGQINAKVLFDPRGFASGGEVGAHV